MEDKVAHAILSSGLSSVSHTGTPAWLWTLFFLTQCLPHGSTGQGVTECITTNNNNKKDIVGNYFWTKLYCQDSFQNVLFRFQNVLETSNANATVNNQDREVHSKFLDLC